ncbi:NAD(P)H-flavin reductase [Maribrevibacterium harenarium]|uniref:NAD(P)H-flavin reductase n=1 Tax=Maribrevibacterium harenarium TaxID=2589817 RepID=A0A501WQM4_9GAMM|nr:NAD(P)H-flavin reductase [Maribrevibacterium harenarium]TPE48086.1 NAD(P)H-flavin reductase [Maribrevibacterium harenarium]
MEQVQAKVNGVHLLNNNVYQVDLSVADVNFIAGQYLMICLPTGEKVPYSIGSAPHQLPHITLYILVTDETSLAATVIRTLNHNEEVTLMIPGGDANIANGALDKQPEQVLLLAGGTGFAQMKSIFEHLDHSGYAGKVCLYWGLRSQEDVFLQDWLATEHRFDLQVVLNEGAEGWSGRTGWLYEAVLADHPDLSRSVAFISGSVGMVYGTLDHLEAAGLATENAYSDVFAYAPRPAK